MNWPKDYKYEFLETILFQMHSSPILKIIYELTIELLI